MFRSVLLPQHFTWVINFTERLDDLYRGSEWKSDDQAAVALALIHALAHTEGVLRVRLSKMAIYIEDRFPESLVQESVSDILNELARDARALAKGAE